MDLFKLLPFIFLNECIFCGKEYEGTICKKCKTTLFVSGKSKTKFNNQLYYLTIYKNRGEMLIDYLKNRKYHSIIPYLIEEAIKLIKDENFDYITSVPSIKFFSYIPQHLELFSKELSKIKRVKYIEFFYKKKKIKSQVILPINERLINPIGAFSLRRDYIKLIDKKRILIVDDVYTTGSTLGECEKLLLNNGGSTLSLVFSKTI